MTRMVLIFLAGIATALIGRQAYDLSCVHREVLKQWHAVVAAEQRRPAAISALIQFADRHGASSGDEKAVIAADLPDIAKPEPDDLVDRIGSFAIFDRDCQRLTQDIVVLTRALYLDPAVTSDASLSTLQSRLEGTESAALQSHLVYNSVALDYEATVSGGINRLLAQAMLLPRRVGVFETFGEAGPKDQEGSLKDADD